MKGKAYNQTHLLVFLFAIFCFTKLALIRHVPFINDEAYTLTISRYFSLSYFDHPPLMMWLSYLLHFFGIDELYIFRIPFIAFGLLTSFFLYKISCVIYSKETGVASAVLYFFSPFFFFSGGLFIVPDASLNFSVAGATYIAIRLIFNKENNIYLWVALGLLLSVAFLSKYQAYVFGMTLFVSFIIWKRDLIFTKKFYISLAFSILGLVPIIFWNLGNKFSSFTFHGSRSSFDFDLLHVLNSLIAQLFLLLPTTGILIIITLIQNKKSYSEPTKFLIFLALPIIIIFNILIILSDNSFAHWSMVGWMLLIPVASNYLISMKSFKPQLIALKGFSVFVTVIMISIVIVHANTGFITKSYGEKIPAWDNTRELLDWDHISKILAKTLEEKQLDTVATLNWYDSGQLTSAFHFKHTFGVIGSNDNHFKYINLNEKNFTTLVDVQLINSETHTKLQEKVLENDYKIVNRLNLPFFRGNQRYGTISILSLERTNSDF